MQPTNFLCQMKASQDNKYDITKSSGLVYMIGLLSRIFDYVCFLYSRNLMATKNVLVSWICLRLSDVSERLQSMGIISSSHSLKMTKNPQSSSMSNR